MVNERGERLTIMNCNRQPLEQTLGVDLIYYNHLYESFILIQYKRMVEEAKGKVCYRPDNDANYNDETKENADDQRTNRDPSHANVTYGGRISALDVSVLHQTLRVKAKAALDEGMVSGMYLPIDLWHDLLIALKRKASEGASPSDGITAHGTSTTAISRHSYERAGSDRRKGKPRSSGLN